MKVNRGASQTLQQAQAKKDSKATAKNGNMNALTGGAELSSSAQVSLSKKAQQIKQATNLAKDDSVDEKRIARFQNLIDSGKYQIDSAKVADSLIDEHLKMPT